MTEKDYISFKDRGIKLFIAAEDFKGNIISDKYYLNLKLSMEDIVDLDAMSGLNLIEESINMILSKSVCSIKCVKPVKLSFLDKIIRYFRKLI